MAEFQEIYDGFHAKIRFYLGRLVGQAEAEDLTQEAFVKVSRGLAGFRSESSPATWVYRIATNVALDRLRSKAHRQDEQTLPLVDADDGLETEACREDALADERSLMADREAIRAEMSDCIHEFVRRLPPDYQTVVALSELEGLKNQEIADILGVRLGTVKIRLHRARAKLRDEFESGCQFYRDHEGRFACDRKAPTP